MTAEDLALELRKVFLVEGRLSDKAAATLIGMNQQNFSSKMQSGTLRYLEVAGILENLGYEITWKKKETAAD